MSSSTDSEASATISKSCRPGPGGDLFPRRRELDPGRGQPTDPTGVRVEPDADEPVGDHEVLDAPVRSERRAQPLGVDAGHEEVRIFRLEPEQLVTHGAADEVGIQPEPADVFLDLLAHAAIVARVVDTSSNELKGRTIVSALVIGR